MSLSEKAEKAQTDRWTDEMRLTEPHDPARPRRARLMLPALIVFVLGAATLMVLGAGLVDMTRKDATLARPMETAPPARLG